LEPLSTQSQRSIIDNFSVFTYVTKRNKSSAVAEMGDRLVTIDMARKVGAAVPLSVGELGPI